MIMVVVLPVVDDVVERALRLLEFGAHLAVGEEARREAGEAEQR
jgi:hypothetical protein